MRYNKYQTLERAKEVTDPFWCGSPRWCWRRAWQRSSLHFCFSVENILIMWRHTFTAVHMLWNTRMHASAHVPHCLGLSLTPCHWSQRLHFGLSGLSVSGLSLEPTPWCHPLTPGTSQSVFQCLQKTMNDRKPITTWRISLVVSMPFLFEQIPWQAQNQE